MTTAFFDVDTQLDFLLPAGALYVPGAERLIPSLAKLNKYAAGEGIPLISTMDAHSENDPEFLHWPPHCVAGTLGQRKPDSLLVGSGQKFLSKQTLDCFQCSGIHDLLTGTGAQKFVVYGVVTEVCVRFAVQGLLKAGKEVWVVSDAIQALDEQKAAATLDEVRAAGGRIVSSAEVLS